MNVIGLDFGTTNSILSFYNKTNSVESWKMGGSDGKNYIPSILTFDESDLFIGEEAKNQLKNGNKESYSKFKILLHEKDKVKLANYNYSNKTPKDIAKLYIKTLIETYKKEQCIDRIDSVVITVPEIWLNDDMQGRMIIKEITDELNLPLFKLVSEPVAAGAYFLNNYKEQNQNSFNGHLLVFDYGGGTLDITLLETTNEHIKVLKRSGQGNNKLEIGKAGALFDEKVVMSLYKTTFGEELQRNTAEFYELVLDFEQNKISSKNIIDKKIEQYNKSKILDSEIFKIRSDKGTLFVKASILVETFDVILKNDVINALKEITAYFNICGINNNDPSKFRIIMVGGFSNFYLSQMAVKNFFNSKTDSDERFRINFTQEDTTLAISKGAALIANKFVKIDETYPMTIGIVLYRKSTTGELERFIETILTKFEKVNNNSIKYSDEKIRNIGKITIYLDNGNSQYTIKLDKNPESIFPNASIENNKWTIGFNMDKNNFFYLHIKDELGKSTKTELGNIIEQYKDCLIVESKNDR